MALKTYKPITPSQRFKVTVTRDDVTTDKPERSLLEPMKKTAGRNSAGRITSRHRGGGSRKQYRKIDFKRRKLDILAKVATIEYDPNRSARIALLNYADGEKRYIVAPDGVKVGQELMNGEKAPIRVGNALPLSKIPVGMVVHNVELKPGKGAQMARSAGASVQLSAKEDRWAVLKLPSGEIRRVFLDCFATIGVVSNVDYMNRVMGKAGANRWRGRRPHVRGVAMNPVDHPMGGGEGKTSGGGHPVSPWGQKAKGLKTRRNKQSDSLIIRRRKK